VTIDQLDAVIIGAGISGVNAAYDLQTKCPQCRYTIIESRESLGGTWDLFKYPGIRSDTDMYSLGYRFKPWTSTKAIGSGSDILNYLRSAARSHDIDKHIRFQRRVISASWCSTRARWDIVIQCVKSGDTERLAARFLFACNGYYSYKEGYTPVFPNQDMFSGDILHPQFWPADYSLAGKKVVVIGSGATAITLAPAMARQSAKVTVLQRSPTYIVSQPEQSFLPKILTLLLPDNGIHALMRMVGILKQTSFYLVAKRFPKLVKSVLLHDIRRRLGKDYPVEKHFTPSYEPWDQRVCVVPNGDLFSAIKAGEVTMVTDHIAGFESGGIRLKSGKIIVADVIVTATGLKMEMLSGMDLAVDGKKVEIGKHFLYRGGMLDSVPNAIFYIGYPNASWTLKTDLLGRFACRLINYMRKERFDYCTPVLPNNSMNQNPLMSLSSGYIVRAIDSIPKAGPKSPWRTSQNYFRDYIELRLKSINNNDLKFFRKN